MSLQALGVKNETLSRCYSFPCIRWHNLCSRSGGHKCYFQPTHRWQQDSGYLLELADADNDLCDITFKVSANSGASYDIIPTHANLSGAIGNDQPTGTNKHIIWNAGAESYTLNANNYLYCVYADDGTIPDSFVLVEGGTFNNGTSNITISSFYMDKYELTQAAYQAVMGTNPASGYGVGSNYPVYYVSWFNAIDYCNRRSINEGLTPCYSYSTYGTNPTSWPSGWNTSDGNHTNVACNWTANGYRLPTEAEWEFTARGGNQTHNYIYSGSNDLNAVGWYDGNSNSTNHIAGLKTANELGLYDMTGNVWEWNWDIYDSYPAGVQNNPHGAISGSYLVYRGGCYANLANYCPVSFRRSTYATLSIYIIGFRICRIDPNTVETPGISPQSGTYLAPHFVTISSNTLGATIRYTTDGTLPTATTGTIYNNTITLNSSQTIKAIAYKTGWTPSGLATVTYTINPSSLVFVAGGTFNNGTSDVTVSTLYIDKFELTQTAYQAVMGTNPASGYGVGSNYPVYYVSWFNAIEYCNRRSMNEGLTSCYSYSTYGTDPAAWPVGWNTSDANHTNVSCNWNANGYRLLTAAEWEFAARGGNQTNWYSYSGSNDIYSVAWIIQNSGSVSHFVGTKAPNELGIYDMCGNVYEWNWDIYGNYPSGNQINPHGADAGTLRVSRGGSHSWPESGYVMTVSDRDYAGTTIISSCYGFRVCRIAP